MPMAVDCDAPVWWCVGNCWWCVGICWWCVGNCCWCVGGCCWCVGNNCWCVGNCCWCVGGVVVYAAGRLSIHHLLACMHSHTCAAPCQQQAHAYVMLELKHLSGSHSNVRCSAAHTESRPPSCTSHTHRWSACMINTWVHTLLACVCNSVCVYDSAHDAVAAAAAADDDDGVEETTCTTTSVNQQRHKTSTCPLKTHTPTCTS